MATKFNELSTTTPIPTKDEVDNKIDKLSGVVPIGNLLKVATDGGVEDSGKSLDDISQEIQDAIDSRLTDIVGEEMPQNPTQNELTEVVKTIFKALGGKVNGE